MVGAVRLAVIHRHADLFGLVAGGQFPVAACPGVKLCCQVTALVRSTTLLVLVFSVALSSEQNMSGGLHELTFDHLPQNPLLSLYCQDPPL